MCIYLALTTISTFIDLVQRYRRDLKKVKMSKMQKQMVYEE